MVNQEDYGAEKRPSSAISSLSLIPLQGGGAKTRPSSAIASAAPYLSAGDGAFLCQCPKNLLVTLSLSLLVTYLTYPSCLDATVCLVCLVS